MSYSITVTVKDGTAHSVISGPAPDGTYSIAGHIDDQREDVGVARSTAAGQLASRSSATVYKGV
jgi:hypothetical protein